MPWGSIGALLLALAVGCGAFGAHALRERFDEYSMGIWEKAVFYHFIHALGILIVPKLTAHSSAVCWLLAIGVLLFSGSLYALAFTGSRGLGAVTPLGGVAFLAAWILLAFRLRQSSN